MVIIYFIYGLAFFSLGLAVLLVTQQGSKLPLSRQLNWLAAFGLVHALVEWLDMFLLLGQAGSWSTGLTALRTLLLPVSAVLLVRFGIGLINDAGPLPQWTALAPVVLIVPGGLLVGYGLIIASTEPPMTTAAEIWSRYLLYLPGNLLAAFGFFRQRQGLSHGKLREARPLLFGAGVAFLINAAVAGLVVPEAHYGLASWLNYQLVLAWTGLPVQVWRAGSAIAVTLLVIRAMGIFEAEHRQEVAELDAERTQAQQETLTLQLDARLSAEAWREALVRISRRIANMDEVDQILSDVVEATRSLMKADQAALALWNTNGSELQIKAISTDKGTQTLEGKPVSNPLILETLNASRCSFYPQDFPARAADWVCPVGNQRIQSAAIVSLRLENQSLGGIWLVRTQNGELFSATDMAGLERLAAQAVIAIEHSIMASQLQSLAVVEERGRIAREMHDGLAQILGYLNLEMQALEALVQRGQPEVALAEISQARQQINQAQADVRENILSLRTTLADCDGLVSAVKEYIEEFSILTGIEAEFVCEVGEDFHLSPLAEAQLVRVLQEALANVRKHAQAQSIQVRMSAHEGNLRVSIVDDGIGFKAASLRGHFGLATMRERAESVNGDLTVTSLPGEGTRVELRLPK